MDAPSYAQVTVTPMLVPLVCVVGATLSSMFARRRDPAADVVSVWVRWWFYGALGVGGAVVFLSYLLAPSFMAGTLTFPASVPFEHEVGAANLGFAVAAVLSVRRGVEARWVAACGYGTFLVLATVWHSYESVAHGNLAPGNTGGILVYDLGLTVVALGLTAHQRRTQLTPAGG